MLNSLTTKAYIAATESFRKFKEDNKGVTAIEYGLIALAVAVFVIFVFSDPKGFLETMKTKFGELSTKISKFNVGK